MVSRNFYKELGKLLYALAKADGEIQPKEEEKLIQLLREEQLHSEAGEDIPLSTEKYLTEFEFIIYREKNIAVKDAFLSFINFAKKNQNHIDENMKKTTLILAKKVLKSHKGINRLEQKMLEELMETLTVIA